MNALVDAVNDKLAGFLKSPTLVHLADFRSSLMPLLGPNVIFVDYDEYWSRQKDISMKLASMRHLLTERYGAEIYISYTNIIWDFHL